MIFKRSFQPKPFCENLHNRQAASSCLVWIDSLQFPQTTRFLLIAAPTDLWACWRSQATQMFPVPGWLFFLDDYLTGIKFVETQDETGHKKCLFHQTPQVTSPISSRQAWHTTPSFSLSSLNNAIFISFQTYLQLIRVNNPGNSLPFTILF